MAAAEEEEVRTEAPHLDGMAERNPHPPLDVTPQRTATTSGDRAGACAHDHGLQPSGELAAPPSYSSPSALPNSPVETFCLSVLHVWATMTLLATSTHVQCLRAVVVGIKPPP
eukprot:CAMPEP_0174369420 /NCGR_PEP_ID=MMETSP0811_2-20130205/92415_1 /TAXON_ID=73025 ORGANISM="Eutreptiella gymnastica-like, Strain CCMP1594" /NCGR_SAMPLE_ID=MMETSP0811_2 /ASSEMBLY_ACC=CAM_ASM_000667 /LENGTH=112 /DNA_ID=CAMNT_0015513849 /DNA_START=215 /DNA_END=549 /DNA_ORIENTATION=+